MMDIKEALLQWPEIFDRKASCNGIKNKNMSDQQFAEELCQAIIKKFKESKAHSPFIDNIWALISLICTK